MQNRRLFHSWASDCIRLNSSCIGASVWGWKSLRDPVESSTKPTIDKEVLLLPSGLMNCAPYDSILWTSKSVDDIKSQMLGELPLPWPVPWIGCA